MASKGSYIIVGENIHCTRVRLTKGKFVEVGADGSAALVYKWQGKKALLPLPKTIVEAEDFKNGKVRHVAVAVHQGLYGNAAEQEAGRRYVQAMALEQEAGGAWFLDVNVDEFSIEKDDKVKAIKWAAAAVQEVSGVPLSIDSSDPEILQVGLAACDPAKGKPLVNSVSLERATFIPIAAKAGACVIAGATGETSMPQTVEERLANIERLVTMLQAAGIGLGDIYLDPLVYPVSVNVQNGLMVIDTVKALREKYGAAIHFAPGLSNISYGFPKRNAINQVFAQFCLEAGCDGGIVDPAQVNDSILANIDYNDEVNRLAKDLLLGKDDFGMEFISAFRGA